MRATTFVARSACATGLALLVGCGTAATGAPTGSGTPLSSAAAQPLSLTNVHVDANRSMAKTIGPGGGSLTASAADGTVYTLTIPADALLEETEIGLYPVDSITGFPFDGGLAAGFHLTPEGLQFNTPAVLTAKLASGVSVDGVSGFAYSGDGEDLHRYPMAVDGSTLTFPILHFSGGGAGKGPPPACQSNLSPRALAECELEALVSATPVTATELQFEAILLTWYRATIKPALTGLLEAVYPIEDLDEYHQWVLWATDGPYPPGLQPAITADLVDQLAEADLLAIKGMQGFIAQNNEHCSLLSAKDTLKVMRRAERWNLGQDAHLDRASILDLLCLQVDIPEHHFPDGVAVGQPGRLVVKVGYLFVTSLESVFDQTFNVTVASTADNAEPQVQGETDLLGFYEADIVLQTDPEQLNVTACFADRALREACASKVIGIGGGGGTYTGTVHCSCSDAGLNGQGTFKLAVLDPGKHSFTWSLGPFQGALTVTGSTFVGRFGSPTIEYYIEGTIADGNVSVKLEYTSAGGVIRKITFTGTKTS